jgi:hypothetical protein
MWNVYIPVVIQIVVKNILLLICIRSSFYLCCQNIYLSYISYICFQLTVNYYIFGGWFLSFKYHISSPVFYMVGHHSFSFVKETFVKDTFVSCGLLQFIQNTALGHKCLPLLRYINRNLLFKTSPIMYHS